MQATSTVSATASLLARMKIDSAKKPPTPLAEKLTNLAQFVQGLLHIITSGVCHGDIKPANILFIKKTDTHNARFDIADFGGSKIVYPVSEHMDPEFRFEDETDKVAMKNLVVAFLAEVPNPKQLAAACKAHKKVQQLLDLHIIRDAGEQNVTEQRLTVIDKPKLLRLRKYLQTEFLPAKTDAYACKIYEQAMCDYFWRGEAENYKNACNAFDMRAAGLTMFEYLTAAPLPNSAEEPAFYSGMAAKLAGKVSAKAIEIICRMTIPLEKKPDYPRTSFETPVTITELKELKQIFLADAK